MIVFCVFFDKKKIIMFASAGKSLHIYSLEREGLKTVSKYAPKPSATIKQISWCHDNSYIAILQENEFPQIISTKDPSHVALVHTISSVSGITALKFKSNTKRVLALGTRSGEVMLYDTKHRCVSKLLGQLSSEITLFEFNSANELAAISNEHLVIFNITDSDKVELSNPETCTAIKCFNRNNGQVVVGCINGMIIIWDVIARSEVKTYHLHSAAITGIALSNRDKLMVTTGADNKICVVDTSTQECIFKKILQQPITSVDISTNEQHMVAGLKDGSIYVYQLADHLKPQICIRMHPTSINQISFANGITLDLLESDSLMEEETAENDCEVKNNGITNKEEKDSCTEPSSTVKTSIEDIAELNKETQIEPSAVDVEIPEEKVKLDLIKLVNGHFAHLEEQLADHCGRLQTLVSTELDSLYAVAARWECFKTMELEEIVRYICGIVSASSETRGLSQKSEHTNFQHE